MTPSLAEIFAEMDKQEAEYQSRSMRIAYNAAIFDGHKTHDQIMRFMMKYMKGLANPKTVSAYINERIGGKNDPE